MKFFSGVNFTGNFFLNSNELLPHLVNTAEEADVLLLPFKYEIIHDFSPEELKKEGICASQLPGLKAHCVYLNQLSIELGKPLLVFFYRDPMGALPLANPIVFRTSTKKSWKRANEYGLPAFVDQFPCNDTFIPINKQQKPRVCFRGQSAPLRLPLTLRLRQFANKANRYLKFTEPFNVYYNEGYLLRRAAMRSVLKRKSNIIAEFAVNPKGAIHGSSLKEPYLRSFRENDYIICAAGHGNYSYRLYETMREGRIPVFINTDCLLPCEDVINWKKQTVWIEQTDIAKTGQAILDFHASIHQDDFLQLQLDIRRTYQEYLTEDGFAAYLLRHFFANYTLEARKP